MALNEIHEKKQPNAVAPSGGDEHHIQNQLQNLTSELHVLDEHLDKVGFLIILKILFVIYFIKNQIVIYICMYYKYTYCLNQMQRSAAVSIGMNTPELLTSLEKRRQFSKKKTSNSQKSSDSSSSEGDRTNFSDNSQNMERKVSKSTGLKLHKPHSFLFKRNPVDKKQSEESIKTCEKCGGEDKFSSSQSSDVKRRPSWERPWRNSWDPTKLSVSNISADNVTKSTSLLHEKKPH